MEPFIPWELLYPEDPAQRVAPKDSKFLGELGLVRWLYEGYPPSSLKIGRDRARIYDSRLSARPRASRGGRRAPRC